MHVRGLRGREAALPSSILIQLGEHKWFGRKVKAKVMGLLRRVKWVEVAKFGIEHVGVWLDAGLPTGGVGALPAALSVLVPTASASEPAKAGESTTGLD